MDTFEITIQRRIDNGWPVVIEQKVADSSIPVRKEGLLVLDTAELLVQSSALAYGTLLGQALFRDEVRAAFAQAVAESDERLRVLLFIEADDLLPLRWERLCAPVDREWTFLSLNQRTLFSLYIPSVTDRRFPPIGRRNMRALVVVASPDGLEEYGLAHFDVAATVRQVKAGLGAIPHDVLANVDGAVGPASLDAMAARITTEPYTILHIVCHGQLSHRSGDTSLFLSNQHHAVDRVDGERLITRLRQMQELPHLGFLAACESAAPGAQQALDGLGQRLVRNLGMPAVIAMTDKVSVETAAALTSEFYQHLLRHGEVDRALVEAMTPIAERADAVTPALYSRLGSRSLLSHSTSRPLTEIEIAHGLADLRPLVQQRAPTLLPQVEAFTKQLQRTLNTQISTMSTALQRERKDALDGLEALCSETVDMSFAALCMGEHPPSYDDRCPFRGLHAFQMEDHEFFFGREQLIDSLQRKIERNNFLALLGASGSGKSSLVLAGLLPRLRQRDPGLRICYMTPGSDPVHQLQRHLSKMKDLARPNGVLLIDQFEELFTLCTEPKQRDLFVKQLLQLISAQYRQSPREKTSTSINVPLSRWTVSNPSSQPASFMLAQTNVPVQRDTLLADAMFAQSADEQACSPDLPHPGSGSGLQYNCHTPKSILPSDQERGPGRVRVIITMRADFWGECAQHPELKQLMMAHQELITPLTGAELRRTMELQAAKVGLRFEAALSGTILDEVAGEPGAMPLLQHMLTELWKRRHGRWLRVEEYRRIGGVRRAIAHTADTVYEELSAREQALARNLFVRLTRLNDDGYSSYSRNTRQRILVEEMVSDDNQQTDVKALLARLADTKLVITSINLVTQKEEVEVVHEALLRHWPRLQAWIDDNRIQYRLRQAINQAAQVWRSNSRHDDFLVHRGGQLDDARRLAEEPGFLVAFERAYIEACVALQNSIQQKDLEAARRLAQAAEARQRAEEQARLVAEAHVADSVRSALRLKRRALAVAWIGILAAIAACTASFFWKEARNERDVALVGESQLLTTLSTQQIQSDPVAALDVALQALPHRIGERPYVPAAQLALTQALRTSAEQGFLALGSVVHGPEQVAFGTQMIAVGGTGLHLVTHDLKHSVKISQDIFDRVEWLDGDTLLTTTDDGVQLWNSGERTADVPFLDRIQCLQVQPKEGSGPRNIAVCSGTALSVWATDEPRPTRVYSFESPVRGAKWSPDGTFLVAWDEQQMFFWQGDSSAFVSGENVDLSSPVLAADWSTESKYLVTVLEDGEICIWELLQSGLTLIQAFSSRSPSPAAAGAEFQQPTVQEPQIWDHVQFSGEDRFITWDSSGSTALWTIRGEFLQSYMTENAGLRGILPNEAGTKWVMFTDHGAAYLWSLTDGMLLSTLRGHTASILDASWQGEYVATAGADGTARIWDTSTGDELMTLSGHADGSVSGRGDVLGLFWPDAYHVVTFGEDGTLRRWRVFDGAGQPLCAGKDAYASPLCFRHSQTLLGHQGDIWSARWLNNDTILTTGYDGTARRWTLSTGESLVLPNEYDEWHTLVWDPAGELVLTYIEPSPNDQSAQGGVVRDINSGTVVSRLPGSIVKAFWWETGLFILHKNNSVLRVDPNLGTVLMRYTGCGSSILDLSALGRRMATAHSDGSICIWNIASGDVEQVFTVGEELPVYSVQWSNTRNRLLVADLFVSLWDLTAEEPLWRYQVEGFHPQARWSADERYIAVTADEQVTVLSADGLPVWTTPPHKQPVVDMQWITGAAWDRSGERTLLLTWSGDGSARLWDVEGQSEIMRFSDPQPLHVAAVSPDGAHVLTGGYSGVLRVWESWLHDPETLLTTVESAVTHPIPKSSSVQSATRTASMDAPRTWLAATR